MLSSFFPGKYQDRWRRSHKRRRRVPALRLLPLLALGGRGRRKAREAVRRPGQPDEVAADGELMSLQSEVDGLERRLQATNVDEKE